MWTAERVTVPALRMCEAMSTLSTGTAAPEKGTRTMGRFGHRAALAIALVIVSAGFAKTSVAQDVIAGPAVSPSGSLMTSADAPGSRSAAAAQHQSAQPRASGRPERRASGGEAAEMELRRRFEAEERRRRESTAAVEDELLRQLFRDTAIGVEGPSLGAEGGLGPTPSDAFLRAVCPPRHDFAIIERRGFDRWFMGEVSREWRRRYQDDVQNRRNLARRTWEYEYDAEMWSAHRQLYGDVERQWKAPFPMYWEGHASAERPRVVAGEDLEILRIGRLTVTNDMTVRHDMESYLYAYLPERDAQQRISEPPPIHATDYRPSAPRGNVFSSEICTIDARARVSASGGAMQTGFLNRVGSEVDISFYDRYDRKRIFGVEIEAQFDPTDADRSVAVMFKLFNF